VGREEEGEREYLVHVEVVPRPVDDIMEVRQLVDTQAVEVHVAAEQQHSVHMRVNGCRGRQWRYH